MQPTIVSSEEVHTASGEGYVRIPIRDSSTAMRASLHMILKHTADMFLTITDIIAEKYQIDADEMVKAVQEHPKYKEMYVNPILEDLGYVGSVAGAAETEAQAPPEAIQEKPKKKWSEEAKKAAAEKRAAKKAVEAVATEEQPSVAPPRTFKIKPKVKKVESVE
jgi:hypothetical protein